MYYMHITISTLVLFGNLMMLNIVGEMMRNLRVSRWQAVHERDQA